jgi:hypothetical protein
MIPQSLYLKLPRGVRLAVERLPVRIFRRWHEREVRAVWRSGPPYRPSHRRIIIDITAACNLGCVDCNRSCGPDQAPAPEHMAVDQVERFIGESRRQNRHWDMIQIEGGEPTLHPQVLEIVRVLDRYVSRDSRGTIIQVNTNGYAECSRAILQQLPPSVTGYSSQKTQRVQGEHVPFNVAPVDVAEDSAVDFSQGCFLPSMYGLGLTRHGYYPHPICGAIDRVFGMDVGRKTLPEPGDGLHEQFPQLCRYCGLLHHYNRALNPNPPTQAGLQDTRYSPGTMTASWLDAYSRYRTQAPRLTPY